MSLLVTIPSANHPHPPTPTILGMNVSSTYSSFRIVLDNSCCGSFSIIAAHRWQVPRALNRCTVPGGHYTASVNPPDDSSKLDRLPACPRWHMQPGMHACFMKCVLTCQAVTAVGSGGQLFLCHMGDNHAALCVHGCIVNGPHAFKMIIFSEAKCYSSLLSYFQIGSLWYLCIYLSSTD